MIESIAIQKTTAHKFHSDFNEYIELTVGDGTETCRICPINGSDQASDFEQATWTKLLLPDA